MTVEGARLEISQPVLVAGTGLELATAAMIMIHGRGATAQDILSNIPALNHPEFAYLAPDAPDHTWYPKRFSAPLADNEPSLSSSLANVADLLSHVMKAGIAPERIILFGFSQGACLALEYAARNARRYGALVGLSGALIGPDGVQRDDRGSLDGTPVFLGCSDVDPHVPKYRIEQTANNLSNLSGSVTLRLYPNMEHIVNTDELEFVRGLMAKVVGA